METWTKMSTCQKCRGTGIIQNPMHLRGVGSPKPLRFESPPETVDPASDSGTPFLLELPCVDPFHDDHDPITDLTSRAAIEIEKVCKIVAEGSLDPQTRPGVENLKRTLDPLFLARACIDYALIRAHAFVQIAESCKDQATESMDDRQ